MRIYSYLYIIIIGLILISAEVYGQDDNLLNKEITIKCDLVSFNEIISQIIKLSGINFSYNTSITPKDSELSINYVNAPLHHVLDELLYKYSLEYKQIGKQIILYKNTDEKSKEPEINKKSIDNSFDSYNEINSEINTTTIIVYDTVLSFVNDTIWHVAHDTVNIQKYNTINIYDTLIEKVNRPVSYSFRKRERFAAGIYFSEFYNYPVILEGAKSENKIEKLKNSLSPLYGYNVGLNFTYTNKIFVSAGIGYQSYNQKYDMSTHVKGGYFIIDTLSKYYSGIVDGDTNWVYITEDRWIEQEIVNNYQSKIKYNYIQIPLHVGYEFKNRLLTLEPKLGFVPEFILNSTGLEKNLNDSIYNSIANSFSSPLRKVKFSIYGGLGINFKLLDNIEFIIEPYYFQNLSSVYLRDNWFKLKFYNGGISFNFRYILN